MLARLPGTAASADEVPPASLAFLGDAVFELYVRSREFEVARPPREFQDAVQGKVCAEAQAALVARLERSAFLSGAERAVLRRGRNAASSVPKRLKSRDGIQTYRAATALEVLVGYLFVDDPARLAALMRELGLGWRDNGTEDGPSDG